MLLSSAVVVALVIWSNGADQRAMRTMDPVERAELYGALRHYVDAVCVVATTEPELRDRCDDGAKFMLLFPECDEACSDAMREHLRAPTR